MFSRSDLPAWEKDTMPRTICVIAAFGLLSACSGSGDCLDGAGDVVQGSGEGALFVLPVALFGAGTCAGITAAANDDGATDAANKPLGATPSATPVPAHGTVR